MYYPNIFYCQYAQKGFHADVVHYLSSFSNMAKLLWLTEKYYDCKFSLLCAIYCLCEVLMDSPIIMYSWKASNNTFQVAFVLTKHSSLGKTHFGICENFYQCWKYYSSDIMYVFMWKIENGTIIQSQALKTFAFNTYSRY